MHPSVLAINLKTADAAAFDSFLKSVSAARGVTALAVTNCAEGLIWRLASTISALPHFAAALERLDLSADSGMQLLSAGAVKLARCLHGCMRLVELNLRGAVVRPFF